MKKSIFLVNCMVWVLLMVSCTGKKESSWVVYTSPGESGFIADSLKLIDNAIIKQIEEKKIPGAAALVAKDGKIVYQTVYGFRDIDAETPLRLTDLFRIASMTKPFTSVAILQLYEQGKLKLDDPVSKYIPAFANPQVLDKFSEKDSSWTSKPASREVTIHDLLTHTAGVCYGFGGMPFSAIYAKAGIPDLAVASDLKIETTMDKMGTMPLAHNPGEKFTYGLNTDVLGRVVEVVSGKSLEAYFYENISGPLKLDDTKFFFGEEYAERLTSAYMPDPSDSVIKRIDTLGIYVGTYPVRGSKSYYSGGSGLSSTLQDYFVFCQAILNGGEYNGARILQKSTVDLMCSDRLGALRWADNETFGYGLRVVSEKNPDGTAGPVIDLGWGGAFSTWFTINPKDKVVEVIMTQVLNNPYGDELNKAFDKAVKHALAKQ